MFKKNKPKINCDELIKIIDSYIYNVIPKPDYDFVIYNIKQLHEENKKLINNYYNIVKKYEDLIVKYCNLLDYLKKAKEMNKR